MAISVGNTTNSGVLAGATSTTFALNNNKEDVIVLVAIRDEEVAATATATYAGAAMTEDVTKLQEDGDSANDARTYIFRKQGAATGSNNVVVTFSENTAHAAVFAIAVSDLNDTGQPDATATAGENFVSPYGAAQDTFIDTSITTVAADTIVLDVVYSKQAADFTVGSGRTQIGQLNVNGGDDRAMASYVIKTAAGASTIDWTDSVAAGAGGADDYSHSVVSYKATAASTSVKDIIGGFIPFAR